MASRSAAWLWGYGRPPAQARSTQLLSMKTGICGRFRDPLRADSSSALPEVATLGIVLASRPFCRKAVGPEQCQEWHARPSCLFANDWMEFTIRDRGPCFQRPR